MSDLGPQRGRYRQTPPDQPGLFELEEAAPPALDPRAQFLTGMLAAWTLGERKPPPLVRQQLEALAAQTLQLAALIALQVPNEKAAKSE